MGALPLIPALIAAFIAFRRSAAQAFMDVYLPVLLLLPMYYRWIIPALPDPTFEQAAILPIAGAFFFSGGKARWRFSLMDVFIFALALVIAYSEYRNAGYKEAQNLMFDMVASVVLPYVLTKGLIEPNGLRVPFARRMVMLMFAVSVFSVYEFKMGVSPWKMMNRLFPGQGEEWYTTFRYGFARIAGPYGHAILAGLVFIVGFRIQRWLEWSGHWEPYFEKLRWLKLSKARVITLGLLAGCIMTMCRGPWIGGVLGAAVTAIGRARNRKKALLWIAAGTVIAGIPAAIVFKNYASVGRAHAKTVSQETAAYRKELIDKYVDIALSKIVWGYGRNTWPKLPGAPSIDNYYLLLALMHGGIAVFIVVFILFVMPIRLIRFEMGAPVCIPLGSSLGFTLAGIYIAFAITLGTVYMGLQAIPLFAVITGWSEGYLLAERGTQRAVGPVMIDTAPARFAFRRVVA
jgi:hypothetical protein